MHIERILHTGSVHTSGDLTGTQRFLRVAPPVVTIRLAPEDCEEMPEAWVEPLAADMVIDALVADYRAWLIEQR